MNKKKISIIGCGNIGSAIANGLVKSGNYFPADLIVTKRKEKSLDEFKKRGFNTTTDNNFAVNQSDIIILAVTPQQLNTVMEDIKATIDTKKHIVMSVVSGASIKQIKSHLKKEVPVVRVMPNTAIAIQESMTCICSDEIR